MARGVRQGCLADGFLFAMPSTLSFVGSKTRSFQIIPMAWTFCSRLGVRMLTTSLWLLLDSMTALAPAFQTVDQEAGLNLNHRKCCWVQHGSERREYLFNRLAYDCEDVREMQIVRFAKYVGTMIGPDGHIHHRWTAPRKKCIQVY